MYAKIWFERFPEKRIVKGGFKMAKISADTISQWLEGVKKDDGSYDMEKLSNTVNGTFDKIADKNKPDLEAIRNEMKPEVVNAFLQELKIDGVENIDQFKAHTKRLGSTSTELSEANTRLANENTQFKTNMDELNTKYTNISNEFSGVKNENLVASKNFDMKYKKAIIAEANGLINDDTDFDGALGKVKENFPEWLNKTSVGGATPQPSDPTNQPGSKAKSWKNYNK
jgi:hypothetical protein